MNCVIETTGKDLRFQNKEDAFNDFRRKPGKTLIYLCILSAEYTINLLAEVAYNSQELVKKR